MQAITTNDLVFTNKHQSRAHKCSIGQVDIKFCEVLFHYKTTCNEDQLTQISRTPLLVLAQNMTDEEIKAAKWSEAELEAFLSTNGGYEAVAAMKGVKIVGGNV